MELTNVRARLGDHLAIGNVALFTGAGFSSGLRNYQGKAIPLGSELRQIMWSTFYPNEGSAEHMAFGDVFEAALMLNEVKLNEVLRHHLTIDPSSIPEWYNDYFDIPWYKIYTLNIDSSIASVNSQWTFGRPLVEVSCTTGTQFESFAPKLAQYALNGCLTDGASQLTFSTSQYAARLAHPDQYYTHLASELLTIPFVYIGTKLDESPLWQHIQMRQSRGPRGSSEQRAKSYLVTPQLDRAKEIRLRSLNIEWLKMDAEEFHDQVLKQVNNSIQTGRHFFKSLGTQKDSHFIQVSEALKVGPKQTQFLAGEEPTWSDMVAGRAIIRDFDIKLGDACVAAVSSNPDSKSRLFAVPGTAGSGKSTSLMQLAARLNAEGVFTLWIDRTCNTQIPLVLRAIDELGQRPKCLLVDDVEIFGKSFFYFIKALYDQDKDILICFSIRSNIFDKYFNEPMATAAMDYREYRVPHLTDGDIDKLIDVMELEKRLGVLRGKNRSQQVRVFKSFSGRQLLVAMLSATSDNRFEVKIVEEFMALNPNEKRIYSTMTVASSYKCSLNKGDMLGSVGQIDNTMLQAIDSLVRQHLLVEDVNLPMHYKLRHRVIAERVLNAVREEGYLKDAVFGLASFLTVHEGQRILARSPKGRMVIQIINHDFLQKNLEHSDCSLLYADLEPYLHDHYHYWLQRGSREVEMENGSLVDATNYLGQARSLYTGIHGNDLIENEYAYLLFKRALERPSDPLSAEYVDDAIKILVALFLAPRKTPHPYHVLGSQGLSWCRYGIVQREEKVKFLKFLIYHVENGVQEFTRNTELSGLLKDLNKEYLGFGLTT